MVELVPLAGLGEIGAGVDLAGLLVDALAEHGAGEGGLAGAVLVVTQKIVSKAEGRIVRLADVSPGEQARRLAAQTGRDPRIVELILAESVAVVRATPQVLITRHRLGLVMANAGIDQSNIGPGDSGRVLLLPVDPDGSAQGIRAAIERHFGVAPAVVIADSFGRPWRNGVVGVAIGAAGLPSLWDRRGEADRDGRPLEVTQVAIGDMVAAAAGLVTGEGSEGIPAVLIRGLQLDAPIVPAAALVRPPEMDLFR